MYIREIITITLLAYVLYSIYQSSYTITKSFTLTMYTVNHNDILFEIIAYHADTRATLRHNGVNYKISRDSDIISVESPSGYDPGQIQQVINKINRTTLFDDIRHALMVQSHY